MTTVISATSPAGMRSGTTETATWSRCSSGTAATLASSAAVPSSDQVASSTIDWPGIASPTLAGTTCTVNGADAGRGDTTRAMAPTRATRTRADTTSPLRRPRAPGLGADGEVDGATAVLVDMGHLPDVVT